MPRPSRRRVPVRVPRSASGSDAGGDRLVGIQLARGVAALAVVMFHATFTEAKHFADTPLLPEFFGRGYEGVDFFFVVSGFVMGLTTQHRHGSAREVGRFLWDRLFRIFPTYWVYALVLLPVALFLPQLINQSTGGGVDLLASFTLWPTASSTLLMVSWTLTLELWFYLVFALLLFARRAFLPLFLAGWAGSLIVVNVAGRPVLSPGLDLVTNPLALEFILGVAAAAVYRRMSTVAGVAAIVTGAVIVVVWGESGVLDPLLGAAVGRPVLMGVGFALVAAGISAVEARRGLGGWVRLRVLGDMSYSVYLAHLLVLAVMGRGWSLIAERAQVDVAGAAAWWVLTLGVVLAVGYLSYRFIERPALAFARRTRERVLPRPAPADDGAGGYATIQRA